MSLEPFLNHYLYFDRFGLSNILTTKTHNLPGFKYRDRIPNYRVYSTGNGR